MSFHTGWVIHVALVASANRPHVRFASESDRIAAQQRNDAQCQKRHEHRSKPGRYSITSSASASRVGGMSRPSVLAVLRLITRWNLVGCWIGRSAGLAPLRIWGT